MVEVYPIADNLINYPSVNQIVKVTRIRIVKGQTEFKEHFYVSSLENKDAKFYFKAIRNHWRIENSLHWVRDVILKEDDTKFNSYSTFEKNALYRSVIFNLLKLRFGGSIKYAMELVANRPFELWKTLRT